MAVGEAMGSVSKRFKMRIELIMNNVGVKKDNVVYSCGRHKQRALLNLLGEGGKGGRL